MVDSGLAFAFIATVAVAPIITALAAAWALKKVVWHAYDRWILLPAMLLLLGVWILFYTSGTLLFSPANAPRFYAPFLALLLLTWMIALPAAVVSCIRGLFLFRNNRLEASLNLVASVLYGSLFYVFNHCAGYFPHV